MSAGFGARVAIAEERYFGGTCVNVGCVPKKLFVYGSQFSEESQDASAFGWSVNNTGFNWSTLRDNKTKEIKRLNNIYVDLLTAAGVDIFEHKAQLLDSHTVCVDDQKVTAQKILIATGSWPYIPNVQGRNHAITSNEMFYLDQLPNRLAIVGGGYIAVEFAGIAKGLGVETTLIYRGPLFLRGFDIDIRQFVCEELRKKEINLIFEDDVAEIRKNSGKLQIVLASGKGLDTDEVLYATGRHPLVSGLGIENTYVSLNERRGIEISDKFQTRDPNIFALGDVTDRHQLTPVAIAEGSSFARTQFNQEQHQVNYDAIPTCVFCQPNIGTVGRTEEQAQEIYSTVDVYESSFTPMKLALTEKKEQTYMKLLVDRKTDRVIGAHMVGPDAGEIIQGLAVAITAKATKSDFDRTIGIHPTLAEEFVTMRNKTRSIG